MTHRRSAAGPQPRRSRLAWLRSLGALAVLLLGLCAEHGASAREKKPPAAAQSSASAASASTEATEPPPPDAPMRAHYDYGRAMFAKQEYIAAAQAMERAYAKEPRPILMLNVGQSYRKAGRYKEALAAYQLFLEQAPQHPMAADARDYIRTIQLLTQQEEKRKQVELTLEQTQEELERMRKPPIYKRAWFWGTVLGGVAAVVAIGVGVKVYRDQRASDSGLVSFQF